MRAKGLRITTEDKELNQARQQWQASQENLPPIKIEELGLNIRIKNALRRSSINTVEDFFACTNLEIGEIRNLGRKSRSVFLEQVFERIQSLPEGTA